MSDASPAPGRVLLCNAPRDVLRILFGLLPWGDALQLERTCRRLRHLGPSRRVLRPDAALEALDSGDEVPNAGQLLGRSICSVGLTTIEGYSIKLRLCLDDGTECLLHSADYEDHRICHALMIDEEGRVQKDLPPGPVERLVGVKWNEPDREWSCCGYAAESGGSACGLALKFASGAVRVLIAWAQCDRISGQECGDPHCPEYLRWSVKDTAGENMDLGKFEKFLVELGNSPEEVAQQMSEAKADLQERQRDIAARTRPLEFLPADYVGTAGHVHDASGYAPLAPHRPTRYWGPVITTFRKLRELLLHNAASLCVVIFPNRATIGFGSRLSSLDPVAAVDATAGGRATFVPAGITRSNMLAAHPDALHFLMSRALRLFAQKERDLAFVLPSGDNIPDLLAYLRSQIAQQSSEAGGGEMANWRQRQAEQSSGGRQAGGGEGRYSVRVALAFPFFGRELFKKLFQEKLRSRVRTHDGASLGYHLTVGSDSYYAFTLYGVPGTLAADLAFLDSASLEGNTLLGDRPLAQGGLLSLRITDPTPNDVRAAAAAAPRLFYDAKNNAIYPTCGLRSGMQNNPTWGEAHRAAQQVLRGVEKPDTVGPVYATTLRVV
eukprot:Hpha_TRINITY_DN34222_c0_g1::TRINITY_DN34222_c0_g1_i1::g.34392::m.34392